MSGTLPPQVSRKRLDGKGSTKDLLAEMIMHLFADATLLPIGGVQESMLQEPRFGRIADGEQKSSVFRADLKGPDLYGHDCAILRSAKDLALRYAIVGDAGQAVFKIFIGGEKRDVASDYLCLWPSKYSFRRGTPAAHLSFAIDFD